MKEQFTPEIKPPVVEQEPRERVHEGVIGVEDRDLFAKVSNDYNPIHFGESAIVHGMHVVSLVSGAVVKEFGEGTVVTGVSKLDMRASIPVGTPFQIIFEEPELIKDSKFGESEVFALVAKQVVINGPQGSRFKYKKAMTAVFQVILAQNETEPDVPSSDTVLPTSDETLG